MGLFPVYVTNDKMWIFLKCVHTELNPELLQLCDLRFGSVFDCLIDV